MPFFAYNNDIPDAPNNPSQDQPLMKTNTNSTDDIIDVDHFSFNQVKGGSHKQVTLTNKAAPGLGDGDGAMYANLSGGNSWPFWQNALGSFQILGPLPSLITPLAATNGFTYLPGGIIFQWGAFTMPSGASGNINYPMVFPNNVFSVVITSQRNSTSDAAPYVLDQSNPPNNTRFRTLSDFAGSHPAFFIAIGN